MGGPAYSCCHSEREIREGCGGGGGSGGDDDVPPRESVADRLSDGPHTTLYKVADDGFADASGDDEAEAGRI